MLPQRLSSVVATNIEPGSPTGCEKKEEEEEKEEEEKEEEEEATLKRKVGRRYCGRCSANTSGADWGQKIAVGSTTSKQSCGGDKKESENISD